MDEFEQIMTSMQEDEDRQLAHLAEMAAKLEEEERKRHEEREAILEASRAQRDGNLDDETPIQVWFNAMPLNTCVQAGI